MFPFEKTSTIGPSKITAFYRQLHSLRSLTGLTMRPDVSIRLIRGNINRGSRIEIPDYFQKILGSSKNSKIIEK
jgi:hypothetical protein